VLITTEEDAEVVFGISGTDYREVARKLADRFGFKVVTITIRGDLSVLHNTWTAIAYADGTIVDDRVYDLELVDRVGGGGLHRGLPVWDAHRRCQPRSPLRECVQRPEAGLLG
jgi:2-dehydro-3-deoxygluconokinase